MSLIASITNAVPNENKDISDDIAYNGTIIMIRTTILINHESVQLNSNTIADKIPL